MKSNTAQLLEAIGFSETMLRDAEAGNWENVIATEAERSACLTRLFSGSSADGFSAENKNRIRQILSINEKIASITIDARNNIRKEIGSVSIGRKVVELYSQNSG